MSDRKKRQRQANLTKGYCKAVEYYTSQFIEVSSQLPPTSPVLVSGWTCIPGCLVVTLFIVEICRRCFKT